MANTTVGPNPKKETVYSGPSPSAGGTVYNGPGLSSSYGGPASGGTVYGGPGSAGTTYNPGRAPSRPAVSTRQPAATRGAGIFFAIAVFSAINTVLIMAGSPLVLGNGVTTSKIAGPGIMNVIVLLNIVVVGIFVLLGIAARAGSKPAFVIGMVIYGADTALLLMSHPEMHIGGIVIHAVFIISLFKAFNQLGD